MLEAARPFWEARPEDEHHVISGLLSNYKTFLMEDNIRASLNWIPFQHQDMARFLGKWIDHLRQHGYSPENILEMLSQLLQNLCR